MAHPAPKWMVKTALHTPNMSPQQYIEINVARKIALKARNETVPQTTIQANLSDRRNLAALIQSLAVCQAQKQTLVEQQLNFKNQAELRIDNLEREKVALAALHLGAPFLTLEAVNALELGKGERNTQHLKIKQLESEIEIEKRTHLLDDDVFKRAGDFKESIKGIEDKISGLEVHILKMGEVEPPRSRNEVNDYLTNQNSPAGIGHVKIKQDIQNTLFGSPNRGLSPSKQGLRQNLRDSGNPVQESNAVIAALLLSNPNITIEEEDECSLIGATSGLSTINLLQQIIKTHTKNNKQIPVSPKIKANLLVEELLNNAKTQTKGGNQRPVTSKTKANLIVEELLNNSECGYISDELSPGTKQIDLKADDYYKNSLTDTRSGSRIDDFSDIRERKVVNENTSFNHAESKTSTKRKPRTQKKYIDETSVRSKSKPPVNRDSASNLQKNRSFSDKDSNTRKLDDSRLSHRVKISSAQHRKGGDKINGRKSPEKHEGLKSTSSTCSCHKAVERRNNASGYTTTESSMIKSVSDIVAELEVEGTYFLMI